GIDVGPVDGDDAEIPGPLARGLRRDQGGGTVAGAEIEDAGAVRQLLKEAAPAVGNLVGIIGLARTVEARRNAVEMPVLAPDFPLRQASPFPPNTGNVTGSSRKAWIILPRLSRASGRRLILQIP